MYKNDKLEAFVQRRIAAAKKPRSPMQAMIIDMFKRHWMNGIVYSVIVINVVVFKIYHHPSHRRYNQQQPQQQLHRHIVISP